MSVASTLLVLAVSLAATPGSTPSSWSWQTAATQGGFVVVGALIAFTSTWASDRRKLKREDDRQWNAELKASYVAIATAVMECHREVARIRAGTSEERLAAVMLPSEEAMRRIQEQVRLLELIARKPVIDAAKDVQRAIADMWQAGLTGPTGDSEADEFLGQGIWLFRNLENVDVRLEELRARIRGAIRVEPTKRAGKKASKRRTRR